MLSFVSDSIELEYFLFCLKSVLQNMNITTLSSYMGRSKLSRVYLVGFRSSYIVLVGGGGRGVTEEKVSEIANFILNEVPTAAAGVDMHCQ